MFPIVPLKEVPMELLEIGGGDGYRPRRRAS